MRAVKDSLAVPLRAKVGESEDLRQGYWHVSACQWVGGWEEHAQWEII